LRGWRRFNLRNVFRQSDMQTSAVQCVMHQGVMNTYCQNLNSNQDSD
jgi:hypothetical protein